MAGYIGWGSFGQELFKGQLGTYRGGAVGYETIYGGRSARGSVD
jgi:hypothetical protein